MRVRWRTSIIGSVAVLVAIAALGEMAPSGAQDNAGYTPLGTPAVAHAAVASNFKVVRDWIDEKDFLSAAQAMTGLRVVLQLNAYQSAEPAWRERSAAFQDSLTKLSTAIGKKSLADCKAALAESQAKLDELAKNPPAGPKVVEKAFRPAGSNKTWMLIMDGAHVDAKRAETAKDLDLMARVLAEEAHLLRFIRNDAAWRQWSDALRDQALEVAKLTNADDLGPARAALKEINKRCEACHQRTKK